MKRDNNFYPNILNYDIVLKEFTRIKHNCKNKALIYNFEMNLNQNIINILKSLNNKTYLFNKYKLFIIKEPKYRLIMSENISDKLVNHLVSEYLLLPSLEKKLIDSNVATRYLKGSGYAMNLMNKYINTLMLEKKKLYVLKIDIKKYFYNIDHKTLISNIEQYVKDKDVLMILKAILSTTNEPYINEKIAKLKTETIKAISFLNISFKEKELKTKEINSIPFHEKNKGLPIGNMTSQILAVFYLNGVDHFIKEKLKCEYYIRYMDDLIILDNNLSKLKIFFVQIEQEINKLKLEVNKKSRIYQLDKGFSFLGYTFNTYNYNLKISCYSKTYRKINRHLNKLAKTDLNKYKKSLSSYKGYFMKCNLLFICIIGFLT